MIETVIALILAVCQLGEPLDWQAYYTANPTIEMQISIRLQHEDGIQWLYVFEDGVYFLTRPDTQHGHCARKVNE